MAKANLFKLLVDDLAAEGLHAEGARDVADAGHLGGAAQDALGELAYLSVNADGSIGPEEERLLREWFLQLDGLAVPYGKRFDTYADRLRADGRTARLTALAALLGSQAARRLGYALVFALTNSDLARSPREERFESDVAIAFGLDSAQTGELEQLVMSKLGAP